MKYVSLILRIISFIILIGVWAYTALNFEHLPDQIPVHYDFSGSPDRYGSRHSIWLLLSINTAVFIFLNYLFRNTDSVLLNVPDNIRQNKPLTQLIVCILMILVVTLFAIIAFESIQAGLGNAEGLSSAISYLLGFCLVLVVAILIYSTRISKNQAG